MTDSGHREKQLSFPFGDLGLRVIRSPFSIVPETNSVTSGSAFDGTR